ncbi:MAG: anti-sigma factor family protein, partial [Gemmatimonadales bacterium]
MPHVDEGTLHALLDGELAPEAMAEVRLHFATCPTCAARLDEARQLLAETERLVSALQLPGAAAPRAAPQAAPQAAPAAAASASAVADSVLMPPSPGSPLPPLDPVVLIPENPTVREVRRSRMRAMAWAAGFLVVVGAGYLGVTNLQFAPSPSDGELRLSPDEFTSAPVPTEREGADSTPTLGLTDATGPAPARTESAASAPAPAPAVPPAPEPKPELARAAVPPPPASPAPAPARADAKRAEPEPQLTKAAEAAQRDNAAPQSEPGAVDRGPAARATFELDRRRMRERAAEATAALDRDRELAER